MNKMLNLLDMELSRGSFGNATMIHDRMMHWHYRNSKSLHDERTPIKDLHPLSDYFSCVGDQGDLSLVDKAGSDKWRLDINNPYDNQLLTEIERSPLIGFNVRPLNDHEFESANRASVGLIKALPYSGKDVVLNIKKSLLCQGAKFPGLHKTIFTVSYLSVRRCLIIAFL